MTAKIQLQNPERDKSGTSINQAKYDAIQAAIIEVLRRHKQLTYLDLASKVEQKLAGKFDGSIRWYVTTVKLDLESRHVIERVKDKRHELVQLASK